MTFRAERYPADWPEIRAAILARAGNRCECTGECGECGNERQVDRRCNAPNGVLIQRNTTLRWAWRRHEHNGVCMGEPCGAVVVVLTIAHVDHNESNNDPSNLRALCQRCHLRLDREDNNRRRRATAAAKAGQTELFSTKDVTSE